MFLLCLHFFLGFVFSVFLFSQEYPLKEVQAIIGLSPVCHVSSALLEEMIYLTDFSLALSLCISLFFSLCAYDL